MLCSSCGETTTIEPCSQCGADPLLAGKYRLEWLLGQGAVGTTYAATRLADGGVVAVKEMPLRRAETEKSRELIDREIALLRQLKHPSIPGHIDDFRAGIGKHRALYLVQEYIDGQSLAAALETHRFSEEEVCDIIEALLSILHYLHSLRPPVIHRDLKPSNVMRRSDGSLALIDFGAARDAIKDPDLGGSTVAGTFGYMAPEQYQGDATPSTDLYALGMLAATLLTRTEPRDLLTQGPLTAGLAAAHISLPLQHFLRALTASEPQDRPRSAQAAQLRLRRLRAATDESTAEPPSSVPRTSPPIRPPRPASDLVPPPSVSLRGSGYGGIAFIALITLIAILMLLWSQAEDPPIRTWVITESKPEAPVCDDGPCRSIGAGQLKGVQLGMTVEEATEAFAELADAMPKPPERIVPTSAITDLSYFFSSSERVEVPGPSLALMTTLISQPARCSFHFAVSAQLSAMQCELLEVSASESAHASLTALLRERLTAQYGPPSHTMSSKSMLFNQEDEWSDETGSLTLQSAFTSVLGTPPTSELMISFESASHAALLADLQERAQRLYDEAKNQKVQAADQELLRLKDELAVPGAGDL